MLKWLGGIATACVIAVMTTAAVSMFQGTINDWFQPDRLSARLDFAPWIDPPKGQPRTTERFPDLPDDSPRTKVVNKIVRQLLASNDVQFDENPYRNPDYFGIARMIIENNTDKEVKNIVIKFKGIYLSQRVFVISDRKYEKSYDDTSKIEIPDMKPGDTTTIFFWHRIGYYPPLVAGRYLDTFSSLGKMDVTSYEPVELDSDKSKFEELVDGWGGIIIFLFVMIGWGATWWATTIFGNYYVALFKDEAFYAKERRRWQENPTNFAPPAFRSPDPKPSDQSPEESAAPTDPAA